MNNKHDIKKDDFYCNNKYKIISNIYFIKNTILLAKYNKNISYIYFYKY